MRAVYGRRGCRAGWKELPRPRMPSKNKNAHDGLSPPNAQSDPATLAAGPAAVAAALRAAFPEYRRRKEAIFLKMVNRALAAVGSAGGAPGAGAGGGGAATAGDASSSDFDSGASTSSSSGDGDSEDDDAMSGDDDSDEDAGADAALDAEERAAIGEGGCGGGGAGAAAAPIPAADVGPNAAMLRMYATAAGGGGESAPSPSLVAPGEAFAPPAAVAAAAACALAAEAAAVAAAAAPAPTPAPPVPPPTRRPGAPPPAKRIRMAGSGGPGAPQPSRTPPRPRPGPGVGGPSASTTAFTASTPRPITYADLGGMEAVLAQVREVVEYPLAHPEVYAWLGVHPPRGVLLHGPPGCGKTALAHAIANEAGVPFLSISAPEIVAGVSGESEAKLRDLFAAAAAAAPAIIFIDEVDAIAPKRESAQREMERRIVAQLLTCMDDLAAGVEGASAAAEGEAGGEAAAREGGAAGAVVDWAAHAAGTEARRRHVVVIGATNRPDAIDPALRRAGRFDRELGLGVPSLEGRAAILKVVTRGLRLGGELDLAAVAARTPGFVGADLAALAKEAAAGAVTRIFQQTEKGGGGKDTAMAEAEEGGAAAAAAPPGGPATPGGATAHTPPLSAAPPPSRLRAGPLTQTELVGLAITPADFEAALGRVQPSVRREGFATAPAATWADVGALGAIREELEFAVTRPIQDPARYAALGLAAPTGVLLYGPPGCGKTLLARAVAAESGANFVSIKGPELLNKWVGESEAAVRRLFARARAAAPCVVFFDELDALAPRRGGEEGGGGGGGGQAAERVVNQLLTELDGLDGRGRVFVVGATNSPDIIDPALLRPGRLDKALYVPLPPPEGRADIMATLLRSTPLAPGAAAAAAALAASPSCDGFSGADLAALVREAAVAALREDVAAERAEAAAGGREVGAGVGAGPGARPSLDAAASVRAPPRPPPTVGPAHFTAALSAVVPSVSKRDQRTYDALRRRLGAGGRARLVTVEDREGGGGPAPPVPPPAAGSDPVPDLA